MHEVKVRRGDLPAKVKANRAEHRAVFEKAQTGYRALVIQELDQMLAEAKAGKKIRRGISLAEPIDQTKDYDRVIAMLEMSTDDEITLTDHEFSNYVLDDWNWKQNFTTTNSRYLN